MRNSPSWVSISGPLFVISFGMALGPAGVSLAQDKSYDEKLDEIVVEPEETDAASPVADYVIPRTQKVKKSRLQHPGKQSIADLMRDEPGVNTQTYCANCGAKRLTINGLKGEHTTILIDGLPLHSAVSSFYGVDSIPLLGIADVEVMRGTGASLTTPEAIGGTINILTTDPLKGENKVTTSAAVNPKAQLSRQNHAVLGSFATASQRYGVLLGLQSAESRPWDTDDNGIAEAPLRRTQAGMLKFRLKPTDSNDISLRLSLSDLSILGGPADPIRPRKVREIPSQQTDFEDTRVDRRFLGDRLRVADWISLRRYEAQVNWTKILSPRSTLTLKLGGAKQEQRSFYQHGFDYNHTDNLGIADLSYGVMVGNSHLLTIGVSSKIQRLRSTSDKLFEDRGLPKDSFDHASNALYLQDTFLVSDSWEVDAAVRFDQLTIKWLDLDNSIEKSIVAPRLQVRHSLSDHLTQRMAYGFGYRAPLTYFESQHGNNENGYIMDIADLERAHSVLYSVSYNTPSYYLTPGIHYTRLSGMAYGVERQGQPITYENTDEEYVVWVYDLLAGYQITPAWMVETTLESFDYEDGYAEKLPTAAIERRIQLSSEFKWGSFQQRLTGQWVGARDLSRYGSYRDHYFDRKQFPPPEQQGDLLKPQRAPAYYLLNASVDYTGLDPLTVTVGVDNITNFTQASVDDTPATWHWHFDHAHFDGLHTWGPNTGREVFLKLAMVW